MTGGVFVDRAMPTLDGWRLETSRRRTRPILWTDRSLKDAIWNIREFCSIHHLVFLYF
jgi:hypothetical protein